MPLRILAKNVLGNATPACSYGTVVSGYPASNALTSRRSDIAKVTPALAGAYQSRIDLPMPADVSFNMAVVCRTALTIGGTLQIISQNAAATVLTNDTVGAISGTSVLDNFQDETSRSVNNFVLYRAAQGTVRSLSLIQTDSVGTVQEYAKVMAGTYYQTALNFDWGNTAEWVDPGSSAATYGGDLIATYGGPARRKITLPFNGIPEVDRAYLYDLMRAVGTAGELFISLWPGAGGRLERDHQMWCRIANTDALRQSHVDFYGSSITFVEC